MRPCCSAPPDDRCRSNRVWTFFPFRESRRVRFSGWLPSRLSLLHSGPDFSFANAQPLQDATRRTPLLVLSWADFEQLLLFACGENPVSSDWFGGVSAEPHGRGGSRSEVEAALYGTIEERERSTVLHVDFGKPKLASLRHFKWIWISQVKSLTWIFLFGVKNVTFNVWSPTALKFKKTITNACNSRKGFASTRSCTRKYAERMINKGVSVFPYLASNFEIHSHMWCSWM